MKKILLLFATLFTLAACVKPGDCVKCEDCVDPVDPPVEPTTPVVYVVGQRNLEHIEGDVITTTIVATMWIDGVEHMLSETHSVANAVYVSESDDVYAAGYERTSGNNQVATIWKNGEAEHLSNNTSGIYDIFVSEDGDVYAGGVEYVGLGNSFATVWVNGTAQRLSSDEFDSSVYYRSFVHSIFVVDGTVYAAGYVRGSGSSIAKLWVNGQEQTLSDGVLNVEATSVFVSDGDIYVAVVEGSGLLSLMKNGVEQFSHMGTTPWHIFVEGNDVYAAGTTTVGDNAVNGATLIKNGDVEFRSENNSLVRNLFVFNGASYVVGFKLPDGQNPVAALWVDGVPQILPVDNPSTDFNMAHDVFVK